MGPWNSDGIFGYSSVPIAAVEKAAERLENPDLMVALSRLKHTSERNTVFMDVLEAFGPALIEGIVLAYKEYSRIMTGNRLTPKPPRQETRRVSVSDGGGMDGRKANA